ncbi:MAG: GNAT family N-acetyltransferase [Cyanobacteria bacterium P01_A01_bin.135]
MLTTPRLRLRPWQPSDLEPFAQLNADPEVRRYFPNCLTREESDASVARFNEHIDQHGFGFWAVELRDTGEFIGFTGLDTLDFDVPFAPAVEIGWRLGRQFWGQGYATEGAREALRYGFEELNLDEIVSITAVENRRSRAVMERLGMAHCPEEDFDHPALPAGHPLQRHVLYRCQRPSSA